jgi:peptide/nickel transport system substrate-binding protein
MHPRLKFALGAAAVAGWLAVAGVNAQTLTMGLAAAPTSVDPHYHTFGPNETVDIHIFDLLTDFDAGMHIQPALATSWKLIDDTTW